MLQMTLNERETARACFTKASVILDKPEDLKPALRREIMS
jgi:hypothetical protein